MRAPILCQAEHLTKRYGKVTAVQDVSFPLASGEILSIIGPSGAGKTTLLRLMAGLESPDSGMLQISESSRDTRRGGTGGVLVFQDFLLFPSMTIAENIGFGLRARRLPRGEVTQRVTELLEAFGITDKADDYPAQLSAGQQQRVALARALAVRPRMLLLDEPFAHLDKALKMDTAMYLRRILQDFGITAIAVTHDLQEAFAMSDRIGVMMDGRLRQLGAVEEVYSSPVSAAVAEFLGPVNRFRAGLRTAVSLDANLQWIYDLPADTPLFCRAESIRLRPHSAGAGVITAVTFIGVLVLYTVAVQGQELQIFSLENGLHSGTHIDIHITHAFQDTKENLI